MKQNKSAVTATHTLTPAHLRLIDALAARDVADYLLEQAALRQAEANQRPKPLPLQPATKAA